MDYDVLRTAIGKGGASSMVDSLEQLYEISRSLSIGQNEPNSCVNHGWKSCFEIESSHDRNAARIVVFAFGFKHHRENPASRINVQYVIQEVPTRHKTVLCFARNDFVLRLKCFDIGTDNKLVVRIL